MFLRRIGRNQSVPHPNPLPRGEGVAAHVHRGFRCWLLASFNWALHPANCELLFFFPRGEGTASPSLWSLFVLGFRAQAQEVVAEPSMLCCRY